MAILESDFCSGDIVTRARFLSRFFSMAHKNMASPFTYPLDEVLMVQLLSQGRGLLVHACGVKYKEKGFLFVGSSGAGKSTMANIWKNQKGAIILSDDRIVIRKIGTQFFIFGTPWHGEAKMCSPESVPLEKIFFLARAQDNVIKRLAVTEAASRLLVCAFVTFWDKQGMGFSLDFCNQLASAGLCRELGFVPEASVLDYIKNETNNTR